MEPAIQLPESSLPLVVVIGAGFAGIGLVKHLPDKDFRVLLIDRNNYHTFQPLLYQVAIGGLEPDSVAYPVRKIFGGRKNFYFRMAEILRLDMEQKQVITSIGAVTWDYLVLASGSTSHFFNMKDMQQNGMTLKSVTDALNLRSLLLQNLEAALEAKEPAQKQALMTMVVVGGGPTGLETAGALAELKKHVFSRDYPELDLNEMKILLVESGPELLAAMSPQARKASEEFIRRLGINVVLKTAVTHYDGQWLTLSTGEKLATKTVVWAAGVSGSIPPGAPDDRIEKGRIRTDAFNKAEGLDNVYAIGDCAAVITPETPKGYPMLAPVAMQQGRQLAKNLQRSIRGEALQPFSYFDKGTMATIGRARAVLDLGRIHMKGFFAWLGWLFVHLMYLVGFRNKIIVLVNWMWNYIRYDSAIRLIIRPYTKK